MATAKTVHAFSNDILADLDATALAALIRSGQASAGEVAALYRPQEHAEDAIRAVSPQKAME